MNIAICFKGVHYINDINIKWKVDFHDVIDNYIEKIYNYYTNKGNNVNIFISSYNTEYNKEVIEKYNPVISKFSDLDINCDTYIAQLNHTLININSIKIYEELYSIKYDIIIFTRFDLNLNITLDEMNIDYNNFNCFYRHNNNHIDDAFWIFPRNILNDLENALININKDNNTLHSLSLYVKFKIISLFEINDFIKFNRYSLIRDHRNNKKRG